MKNVFLLLFALVVVSRVEGQNTLRLILKDSVSGKSVIGATVALEGTTKGNVSDTFGLAVVSDIPDGEYIIVISAIGYHKKAYSQSFPMRTGKPKTVLLRSDEAVLGEIVVQGTRSNRSIANTPTRVEVLTEEIDEAATMDPSKVAHLLTHSTGIQVQQTSATSNTANVRIQGLPGQYTQILKDGFPLYGGFSGSLSIMQIPPLDLRQVEYIKGSASTLYGGGAISGIINLISKEPTGDETLVHLNASHIGAFDVNTFFSRKINNLGITLLAQRNTHRAFDADVDGYSDMPQLEKYNFNPALFFYFSGKTKLTVGGTFTGEQRKGGDMSLMNNEYTDAKHFYREQNNISRLTTQVKFEHRLSDHLRFDVRNSFNLFKRNIDNNYRPVLGLYRFSGRQLSSFSEVALTHQKKQNVIIAGLNFYSDEFTERRIQTPVLRNEGYRTFGAFANYVFDIGKHVSIESGLRTDHVFNEKWFVLPRLSALFKWTNRLTTRVGGGMGYRNPTIFNPETEVLAFQDILPINKAIVKAEESFGGNADVGYKMPLGSRCFINVNQMFFYSYLDRPLVLTYNPYSGYYSYRNAAGYTETYGAETFFKFGFYDFVFFAGYTYTNARNHFGFTNREVPLTPMHSIKGDLLYSMPGKWRIGADYELKSSQILSGGARTPSFWTYGLVVEYTYSHYTVYGNLENFTNVRQTKYASLLTAPYDTPQYTEVWAPLDGIVFNWGVKVRL